MHALLFNADHPQWGSELERAGLVLGAAHAPVLFPYHFLYVTLAKIGGWLALLLEGEQRVGVGFLFPRGLARNGTQPVYTLRYHPLQPPLADAARAQITAAVTAACARALGDAQVVFYDPTGPVSFAPTHQQVGAVDIGRPDATEATAIRSLQQEVWGSPEEFLYPADLHSSEFAAGSSLLARVDGQPAGFLFGFYKFGGGLLPADWETRFRGALRLESQTLGVKPACRGLRIANLLKQFQAQQAWAEGIGIVNWTADPLQYPNAALNFGLLRAMAFDFAPDLYPFRNTLNRVHASRLGITWLVGSHRVRETPLLGAQARVTDLRSQREIPRVNDGWRDADWNRREPLLAIEIPADWTTLQQTDLPAAEAWRQLTDQVFGHYIGIAPGKYTITGVGIDGERRYLLAERSSDALWAQLGTD